MRAVKEANINNGQRVFVRGDLDVPIENGTIIDSTRLDNTMRTVSYIMEKGAFPVIAGHIGRPKGQYSKDLSTQNLLPYFDEKIGEGKYELLENLRFNPGEENNDDSFAKELAQKADIYVNESFSTSHREHASIVGIPRYIAGYAGIRLHEEVNTLGKVLNNPERPFILIVGGAKIEDKMPVIDKFLDTADYILFGGKIGLEWKEKIPDNVLVPKDYATDNLDIGINTITKYREVIETAKTIVWAGPLGKYEEDKYLEGTKRVAQAVAQATENNSALSIIGGGDTIAAVNKSGFFAKMSFASAGGSAMLKFLATGTLVGLNALE